MLVTILTFNFHYLARVDVDIHKVCHDYTRRVSNRVVESAHLLIDAVTQNSLFTPEVEIGVKIKLYF